MKRFKNLMVYALTCSMLFSNIAPALAYTDSIPNVEYQDAIEVGNKNTTVYAEVGSEFKVTIPKHLILDGATKKGSYLVNVIGDIAGTETVNVVPDESFLLKSNNLADVTATIAQDKTSWKFSEMLEDSAVVGNGAIDAKNITAGSWNGNFNFNVSLKEGEEVEIPVDKEGTTEIVVNDGETVEIKVLLDGNNINEKVIWSSDNENVTVDKGVIKIADAAVNGETANVTATVGEKTLIFIIIVSKEEPEKPEQSILTLSTEDVIMGSSDAVQVNAYIEGEEANDFVSWESDNENITVTEG